MTEETRARFLAAIAAQIPADRVQELHLFGAIRQGGTENGIAVVAVARDVPVTLDVDGGDVVSAFVGRRLVDDGCVGGGEAQRVVVRVQGDHGDPTLHAALPDGAEQVHLGHTIRGQLRGDGGEKARARLVGGHAVPVTAVRSRDAAGIAAAARR